jgi:succinoglycan biosynthesis transport protein ExoP
MKSALAGFIWLRLREWTRESGEGRRCNLAQYDINLREYWRILKKRKFVVIFTAVVLGVFSTAFAVLRAPAPIYTSICTIKFEKETTVEGLFARTITWSGGDDIQTQISIIKSYPVFEKVAERLGLIPKTATPSPVPSRGILISIIDSLQSRVEVTRQEETNILYIKAKDKDPTFAQKLANTVAATYKDLHSENQMKRTMEAIKYIEEQLVQVRQKLREAEEEFNRFTQSNQLLAIDLQSEKVLGRTQEIQDEMRRMSETKAEFQSMVQRLDQFIANPSSVQSDFHLSAAGDQYQSANSALTELQLKRDTLLKDFTPLHPEVVEANRKIMENARKMRILLQAEIAELDKKVMDARNDLQEVDKKSNSLMEKKLEYDRLKRKVELYNDMTTLLEHKNQEAQIRKAEKPEEVSIVKPGLFPDEPINPPKTVPTGVMGLLIGIVLGMIAAFIVETFDTSLGAIEDVEETLKTPVWGVVPHADLKELHEIVKEHTPDGLTEFSSAQIVALVSHFAPKSMIAESFRALRTNVQGKGDHGKVKAISVTSASPQEGKTLVSVNLGIAMAQAGLKTLLVGSDMRKPVLGRAFGVELSPGLSDVLLGNLKWREARKTIADILVGKMSVEEVLITPGLDNLHFITGGAIPPNPAELIESKSLRDFIEEAKQEYDFIIFDSPPILSTADAAILGSKVDAVLFVYRIGAVSRGLLKRSTTQLEQAENRLLGVVLNGMKPDISPDFQDLKYYKYYYSYGEKDKTDDQHRSLPFLKKVSVRHKEPSSQSLFRSLLVLLALGMVAAGALWYQGVIDPLELAGMSKPPVQELVKKVVRKALPQGKEKTPSKSQATPEGPKDPGRTQATARPSSQREPPKSPIPASTVVSVSKAATVASNVEIKKAPGTKALPQPPEKVENKQQPMRPESQIKRKPTAKPLPASFPYSLYLGSVKTIEQARKGVDGYQGKGLSVYWVKVNFKEKGEWYRIFVGHFGDREEAEAFASGRGLPEAEVFRTEYANLIGVYSQGSVLEGNMRKLSEHGCSPYTVTDTDGKIRLFVGAYVTKEAAEEYQHHLKSYGVDSQVVKR